MSHAVLSPSSASRWLACTPSARLEADLPYTESAYADEGTLAHKICELQIRYVLGRITKKETNKRVKELQNDPLYSGEMLDYCHGFAAFVLEMYNSLPGAQIFTEDLVDLTRWVPDGFGTVDVRIISAGLLIVIDLKYGKGVPVFAEDNPQLKLYALGAYEEMSHLYNIDTVKTVIYQPRIDNITTAEIPVTHLLKWAEYDLKPRAAMAYEGVGDFLPGPHCQFCKVKPTCKALADYNLSIAQQIFKDADDINPELLTSQEVAQILKMSKFFTDWLTAVEDYALDQAVNHGKTWPGMKLVEGRSVRKYVDEAKVSAALLNAGFEPDDYLKPEEIKGITELTKVLGKAEFEKIVGPYIHKPPGKPVLVPAEDKRPAFSTADRAKEAFKND